MKLVWIGTFAFHPLMNDEGLETTFIRLREPRAMTWDDICQEAGFTPDVVVYSDRSFAPPLVGVENYPCLTCFYVVDSHIHGSWYPTYRDAFDCCAVSLHDHLPAFKVPAFPDTTLWLPPYARQQDIPIPDAEMKWDVLFVGNVDPETTPKRAEFLDRLEALLPDTVHVTKTGQYNAVYPHGRIVLNIAERDDLNFRVFEVMACGACLLTPRVEHGQDQLFPAGDFFESYENLNAEDAAAKIQALLADPEKRKRFAAAGAAEIDRAHRMKHRARDLATLIRSDDVQAAHTARMAQVPYTSREMRVLYLHWADAETDATMRTKYLAAARGKIG